MPYLGEVIVIEADQVALLEVVHVGDLRPVRNLGITCRVEAAAVAARLVQAVIHEAGAIEAAWALRAADIRVAELFFCNGDHLVDICLCARLLRFCGAFLRIRRIQEVERLFPGEAVCGQAVAVLEILDGLHGGFAIIAGHGFHVAKILELFLHVGDVIALHAEFDAVFRRAVAINERERLYACDAIHIERYAKLRGEVHLPLEEAHGVLRCGAEFQRAFIDVKIAKVHQTLLQCTHSFGFHAAFERRVGRGCRCWHGCGRRD